MFDSVTIEKDSTKTVNKNVTVKYETSPEVIAKVYDMGQQIENKFFDGAIKQFKINNTNIQFISLQKRVNGFDNNTICVCLFKINNETIPIQFTTDFRDIVEEEKEDFIALLFNKALKELYRAIIINFAEEMK